MITKRLAAVAEIQLDLAQSDAAPEELLRRIPEMALKLIGASSAVFEYEPGDDAEALLERSGTVAPERLDTKRAAYRYLRQETIRLDRTIRCDDARTDPVVNTEACLQNGFRSILAAVVRDRSIPIGVLELFSESVGQFSELDTVSLELIAAALGAAVRRRRLEVAAGQVSKRQEEIRNLQRDIFASPDNSEIALQSLVQRIQQLAGADGISISGTDTARTAHRCVAGVASLLFSQSHGEDSSWVAASLAPGRAIYRDDVETDDHVSRERWREMGVRSTISIPLHGDDGKPHSTLNLYFSNVGQVQSTKSHFLQFLAHSLNIFLQRQSSTESRCTSQAQHKLLFVAHPYPMWVYDKDTLRILAVNNSAVAKYGYSRSQFLEMRLYEIAAASNEENFDTFRAIHGGRKFRKCAAIHRRKDGSLFDVDYIVSKTNFGGRESFLMLASDATNRRRSVKGFQDGETLLATASRLARIGGWALEPDERTMAWTDELCSIHDVPPGTRLTVDQALGFYSPNSKILVTEAVKRLRRQGESYDVELELITASGRECWVRSTGTALHDLGGAVVGAYGTLQDITETKQAEKRLLVLASSLTDILESITDAFLSLDEEWRFTFINLEAARLMRRPRDSLLGSNLWAEFPWLQRDLVGDKLRHAAEARVTVTFEVFHERRCRWFEVRAYPRGTGLTVFLRDIDDRRREQEHLVLLETCIACMKDMVLISEVPAKGQGGTRIVFVNDAFVNRTGYSRAEAIGQSPRMLCGPQTEQAEWDRITGASERREPVRAEIVNYTKSGKIYWVDIEKVPVYSSTGEVTHFVSVMRDASERRAAQESMRALNDSLEGKVVERTLDLKRSNEALAGKELEMRSVVEHMADAVVIFDDRGAIRSANSKVEDIFGQVASMLSGVHVSLLVPELIPFGSNPVSTADRSKMVCTGSRETSGRHCDGALIPLEVALSDFQLGSERLWTAVIRDISAHTRIVAHLKQAKRAAEEANSAKSVFVATMSHEIRTPMNGVIGMIDLLQQTELATDQLHMVQTVRDSSYALLAVIEDILDFSKIEAGRMELEHLPMSVPYVLDKACSLLSNVAAGKGVRLVIDIDPSLPEAIMGDAGRLRQIIINLGGNAIKFSAGRSGAEVSVRARMGEVGVGQDIIFLEFEDNGIGMDAATVSRLFLPFSQADASTTRRFGGTGLGLAISHSLLGQMGGNISVRSVLGEGSVFSVRLPFSLVLDDLIQNRPQTYTGADVTNPSVINPTQLHNLFRVLVAEDNESNQQVVKMQLSRLGYRAVIVANGREALALWRNGGFDAVLTDLQMPEMDGYELAATIRAEEHGRSRIPIIALTANALKEEAGRCKASGMDDYVTKPLPMRALDVLLQHWLGMADANAEAVDPEVLPSLIGHDAEVIGEMMWAFLESATLAAGEMAEALGAGQGERVRSAAHRLKSSARAVGAIHLGELCEAIENGPLDGEESSLAAYDGELVRVRKWVDAQSWSKSAPLVDMV